MMTFFYWNKQALYYFSTKSFIHACTMLVAYIDCNFFWKLFSFYLYCIRDNMYLFDDFIKNAFFVIKSIFFFWKKPPQVIIKY